MSAVGAGLAFTQANRLIGLTTPLGPDVLLLRSFRGQEAVSQLFHFDLECLSSDAEVDFDSIVGKPVSVRLNLAGTAVRHWSGHISNFVQAGRIEVTRSGGPEAIWLTKYHARMVPWLWFLSRTSDCRIFQRQKVPDIIEKIFKDLDFRDYKFRLQGSYAERDYCVQYRETDLNFVCRLMEEEGICFFFEHSNDKHILVMSDHPKGHEPCPEKSEVRFRSGAVAWSEQDIVTDWTQQQELRPETYSVTDYNFETPKTKLAAKTGSSGYELYDYPGEYDEEPEGKRLSRIRLEEQAASHVVARGNSTCRAFLAGAQFTLSEHYRKDLNGEYLLTAVSHSASVGSSYETNGESGDEAYENHFDCIPYGTQFRPPRVTPQPFVQGCQTAVVVGPGGEEIYTDNYGRVKVQFHWDREGKRNEDSSCWVRTATPWAGSGWGIVHVPRIGEEVIVSFLEGDPDRPIITGSVYNAAQTPPFGLPDGAVISGVKSNSTKGGGGYNQISLDDTKGDELIHVHAQYDEDIKVEHDERVNVGNDRTESVGHDEKITIGNNRTESVGVNETISIGSNRTETVGSNESITVALTRTRNVGVNEMVNVGGAQEITIGGLQALTVGVTRAKTVGTSESVNIGTNQTIGVGGNRTASVGKNDSLQVAKNLTVTAGDQIVLKTGSSSITMKKDGTIVIQGKDITVHGSGKINVKATGDIVMKGSKIAEN